MSNSESIKLADPLLVLIGNRSAILRLAGSVHTLIIGALLIITAGLARNYDHLYLFREWEWLYGPYIASIISSFIIYYLGCFRHRRTLAKRPYLTFLSLYWMTAPCAWLYAFPVESFTDIVTATRWNIAFLATVSIWRVVLVARYVSVMSGERFYHSLITIAWPAAAIMCVASFFKGIELVGIMGGVELSEHQEILQSAAAFTMKFCFFTAIIGFIAHLIIRESDKGNSAISFFPWKSTTDVTGVKPLYLATFGLVALCCISVFLLPFQRQAKNNHTLEKYSINQEYDKAVAFASTLNREDFLEHHELPPGKSMYYYQYYYPYLGATNDQTPEWLIDAWFENSLSLKKRSLPRSEINEIFDEYFPKQSFHHQRIRTKMFEQFVILPEVETLIEDETPQPGILPEN